MKLYEIPIEAHQIEEQLSENYGELTPELEQQIADFVAQGKDKIEAAAAIVKSIEGDAEICEGEASRLSHRAEGLRAGASRLKRLMLCAVDLGFGGKIKTAKFTVWGQNSGSSFVIEVAPDADVYQLAATSPEYFRQREPELNKLMCRETIKKGDKLPKGIIFEEQPGSRSLRIK